MSLNTDSVPKNTTRSGKMYAGAAALPSRNASIANGPPPPLEGDQSVSMIGQFPTEQQLDSRLDPEEGRAPGRAPMAIPGGARAAAAGSHDPASVRSPLAGFRAERLPADGNDSEGSQDSKRSRGYFAKGEDRSYHPAAPPRRAEAYTRSVVSHNPRIFDRTLMGDGDEEEDEIDDQMGHNDDTHQDFEDEQEERPPSVVQSTSGMNIEENYLNELVGKLDQEGLDYFAEMVEKRRKGKKRAGRARPFNAPVSPSPFPATVPSNNTIVKRVDNCLDDNQPSESEPERPVPNMVRPKQTVPEATQQIGRRGSEPNKTPSIKSSGVSAGGRSVVVLAPPITASAQIAGKANATPTVISAGHGSYLSSGLLPRASPLAPPNPHIPLSFEIEGMNDSESEYTSDTSAASSNASDRTKTRKKRKRTAHKRWKKKKDLMTIVKPSSPEKYSGHTNYEKFNAWAFTVLTYFRTTGTPKTMRVPFMLNWLDGKALEWFMLHVRPNIAIWDTARILKGLFDYFFPKNYREIARAKFDTAYQGSKNVHDYARFVQNLALQVNGVTELQIRLRFHDSVNPTYRVKWAEAGYDPEFHSLDQLVEAAERFEAADNRRKHEQNRSDKSDKKKKDDKQ